MKSRLSRSPAGPLAQQSILIVEDEPLVALDVHRVLNAAGASIISAATPGEAIKLLSFAEVTVAIVDLQLGSDDANFLSATSFSVGAFPLPSIPAGQIRRCCTRSGRRSPSSKSRQSQRTSSRSSPRSSLRR